MPRTCMQPGEVWRPEFGAGAFSSGNNIYLCAAPFLPSIFSNTQSGRLHLSLLFSRGESLGYGKALANVDHVAAGPAMTSPAAVRRETEAVWECMQRECQRLLALLLHATSGGSPTKSPDPQLLPGTPLQPVSVRSSPLC